MRNDIAYMQKEGIGKGAREIGLGMGWGEDSLGPDRSTCGGTLACLDKQAQKRVG